MICVVAMALAPLATVPLELQRRMIDDALGHRDFNLLLVLGGGYFLVVCLQGALKYALNMLKGMSIEMIARDMRRRIMRKVQATSIPGGRKTDGDNPGTVISMLGVETEDISGFAGEAIATPLLSAGTIFYVAAYLLWVEPLIAALAVVVYLPQAIIVPVTQQTINRLARLRIQLVRNLGHFAARRSKLTDGKKPSSILGRALIDRLYTIRIWIYLRKFSLVALGNFLDSLGVLIVLMIGGYLVIEGRTQVGTLVVFISGLQRIADPWDQLINFYRSVSNTAVMYQMIRDRLKLAAPR
jgi:ABC-type bacteriocin/lantibiotic exporter with double-glycine peptidase domain